MTRLRNIRVTRQDNVNYLFLYLEGQLCIFACVLSILDMCFH